MSYQVQILLPLADNEGGPFPEELFRQIQAELASRFGGLTAYGRAPATGVWAHRGRAVIDDIVVIEVMTEKLEKDWWCAFRRKLEQALRQQAIVVRAHRILNL